MRDVNELYRFSQKDSSFNILVHHVKISLTYTS